MARLAGKTAIVTGGAKGIGRHYSQALAAEGACVMIADIADGDNLKIECRVNEELRQSSNTADMVFNCKQLVSYISRYTTLKPGDIIFTGTPEGVIAGYPKDKQVWLKPGDKLVTSIEKLGDLHFTLT